MTVGGPVLAQSGAALSTTFGSIDILNTSSGSSLADGVVITSGANLTIWPGAGAAVSGIVQLAAPVGTIALLVNSTLNGTGGGGIYNTTLSGQGAGFGGVHAGCGSQPSVGPCRSAAGSVDGVFVPLAVGGGGSAARTPGSPPAYPAVPGGGGGAALVITAAAATLNGTVLMNGAPGAGHGTAAATGAGAGGTVYVNVTHLLPSGGVLQVKHC
jgi:hypothetical protein